MNWSGSGFVPILIYQLYAEESSAPVENDFLLLNGSDFQLLNGQNLLLL